jgi:4,5-dihydroxyphthalate decarboxylase
MMLSGELHATLLYYGIANKVDRSSADLFHHPDIKTLFPDPYEEGIRFYKKNGIYPINHGMVIRREIAEQHPWAITNLVSAFKRAAVIADKEREEHLDYYLETGTLPRSADKAIHTPLVQHGIKANRKVLETAAQWSLEQGLTPRLMKLDEVFAASTMAE